MQNYLYSTKWRRFLIESSLLLNVTYSINGSFFLHKQTDKLITLKKSEKCSYNFSRMKKWHTVNGAHNNPLAQFRSYAYKPGRMILDVTLNS